MAQAKPAAQGGAGGDGEMLRGHPGAPSLDTPWERWRRPSSRTVVGEDGVFVTCCRSRLSVGLADAGAMAVSGTAGWACACATGGFRRHRSRAPGGGLSPRHHHLAVLAGPGVVRAASHPPRASGVKRSKSLRPASRRVPAHRNHDPAADQGNIDTARQADSTSRRQGPSPKRHQKRGNTSTRRPQDWLPTKRRAFRCDVSGGGAAVSVL